MRVPPGVKEYEESIVESKDLLNRLKKGSRMIKGAMKDKKMADARKMMDLWVQYSDQMVDFLELATVIHQHYMTGNSVVLTNGKLSKVEDIMDMDPEGVEFWELYSVMKMHEIFGDDYKNFVEVEEGESPLN
ncbi:hypothetical protein [Priestia megaterium]|uniref:hypothetical protein n=2 Tax=Priestia megaterium TaxID=1404 RepID=UPI002E1D794D|nr:hypothetical protein [Priestia megaterium]